MKQKFSIKWTGSKQPRKQRKYRANAPTHIRRVLMSSNLSKDLRKKYGKKSYPIVKNDEVMIMRGEFKGKKGKIDVVDRNKLMVVIENITRTKKDGTKVAVFFDPSNLQIRELFLEDRKRRIALEKKGKDENKKTEKKEIKFKKLPKEETKNA